MGTNSGRPWRVYCLPNLTPAWLETAIDSGNVLLRWSPNREPFFYSYEVFRLRDGVPEELVTPDPLRSALWIDTAPPPGRSTYGVRVVSASGVASPIVLGGESCCS